MTNDKPTSSPPGAASTSLPPLPDPSIVGQVPPKSQDISFSGAVDLINTESFTNVHKAPCARQALMTGIASGFAFGGVKLVLRAPMWNACTWATGMFCLTSTVIWEACRWKRGNERDGMIRAMQIMEYKAKERERKVAEKQEVERVRKEEEEKVRKEAERRWWRVW
ncbi:hypothetical protein ABW19_dt0209077 [Dactylella cylindrospora]|nr:hypothetical protein ABW19_dt0209077 [Dactylella cylindrospora]